jgi:hypothetical protein
VITIDTTCIKTAQKILDWMCSRDCSPAESRRKDLSELHDIATKVNVDTMLPPPTADISSSSDWLWNALDIDSSTLQPDLTNPIDLMGPNEFPDDEWFWALNEDPSLQSVESNELEMLQLSGFFSEYWRKRIDPKESN